MSHDKLKAIEEELARQNEALASFKETLTSLGDVELRVPQIVLDELEEISTTNDNNIAMPCFGIRV